MFISPTSNCFQKRSRDGRNVGFNVPDDDVDTIPEDELDIHKRVGPHLERFTRKYYRKESIKHK